MALIEEYRGQANECRRLAEHAEDPTEKSVWLFMQNAWMRLSDDAPKILAASVAEPAAPAQVPPKAAGQAS